MQIRLLLFLFFALFFKVSLAQIEQYSYKQKIEQAPKGWAKIKLPNAIFGSVKQNLSDIRIYGITKDNDTIEVPYLLQSSKKKILVDTVTFKLINTVHNDNGYYYTFEVPNQEAINKIKLGFGQTNFDWQINLEGSQNQKEWFKILNNNRILSIQNKQTKFQYTELNFPKIKYKFVRLQISSKIDPMLKNAKLIEIKQNSDDFTPYSIKNMTVKNLEKSKQTEILVNLSIASNISKIKFKIDSAFDYYRPFTVSYLNDSFKVSGKWHDQYKIVTNGTLNSLGKNSFVFDSKTAKRLRIKIDNYDNTPLKIRDLQFFGYRYFLTANFVQPASYFLVYGNKDASKANYDIARFKDKIPKNIPELELNKVEKINNKTTPKSFTLFENKLWLWGIMFVIIILLAVFSLKMIKTGSGK